MSKEIGFPLCRESLPRQRRLFSVQQEGTLRERPGRAPFYDRDPLIQRSGGAARQERFTVVLGVLPSEDEPNRPCSSLFPPSCPGSHLRPFPSSWPTHRQIWSASFHEPKGFSPSSMTNVIPDSKRR